MGIDFCAIATWFYDNCVKPVTGSSVSRGQKSLSDKLESFLFLEGNYRSLTTKEKSLDAANAALGRNIRNEKDRLNDCDEDVDLLAKEIGTHKGKIPSTTRDYDSMTRCLCSCTPNIIQRYKIGKQVYENLIEVDQLCAKIDERQKATIGHKPPAGSVEELGTEPTVGLTATLDELKYYFFKEENCKVIGVHGKGGIGKSTLLRQFNDFLNGNNEYEVVIYVTVANAADLNVVAIQRKMSERLNLPWDESHSEKDRADTLKLALRRKSFVMLLDDVWKKFDLEAVGIPQPAGEGIKGKLIVAARSLEVCTDMDSSQNNIEVRPLEEAEAWSLFKSNLTKDAAAAVESDSIKPYAKKIVRLCKGLPLALKVIGKAVASRKTRDEWDRASQLVERSPTHLRNVEEKLLARLKFSYDVLDDHLKPCFLYCSLFPEDCSIRKDQLVEHWVGEGFIDEKDFIDVAYTEGHDNIQRLKDTSLLEDGDTESEVKMHDIIRDMALWVASDRGKKDVFLVEAGTGVGRAPKASRWEAAERISLMNNSIKEIDDSPTCNYLWTLFLQNNRELDKLSNGFFQFMPLLRVLDLSYTQLKELPIEDGALPELRYLNLRNTRIIRLANGLGGLKKLISLDLRMTYSLVAIPVRVISRLLALEVLNLYHSHYGKWNVGEGVPLKELEDLKRLQSLGITVQSVSVLKRIFDHHKLKASTRYLTLEYCEGLDSIQISELRSMTQLKELSIHSCHQLKELLFDEATDAEDSIREDVTEVANLKEASLEVLTLTILTNLENISGGIQPNSYFQKLRELTINSCPKLENINWVLQLHGLEKLSISDCKIEEVVEEETKVKENTSSFSKLEMITLKYLPDLRIICPVMSFPSLKTISVLGCPHLTKLPFGPNYDSKKLKKISGFESWWKKLEWEGGSITSALGEQNMFEPI